MEEIKEALTINGREIPVKNAYLLNAELKYWV